MQPIIGKKNQDDIIHNFIEGQLRPNKVLNPALLEAFNAVDRADFLPLSHQSFAYADANLQLANGRFAVSPLLLARLINLVEIQPTDRCLIIGAFNGYSMAVLSCLSENVFALEQDQAFYEVMCDNFKEKAGTCPKILLGLLADGWQEQAPFDFILIEGGVEIIPQKVFDQLSEGGSLVAVHNRNKLMGSGCRWQKTKGIIMEHYLFDAYIPALDGFGKKQEFSL